MINDKIIINKRKIVRNAILLSLSVVAVYGFLTETVYMLVFVPVALWFIMFYGEKNYKKNKNK